MESVFMEMVQRISAGKEVTATEDQTRGVHAVVIGVSNPDLAPTRYDRQYGV